MLQPMLLVTAAGKREKTRIMQSLFADPSSTIIHLEDYKPTPYVIETISLTITLLPEATTITARTKVRPRDGVANPGALQLDGDDLRFISIAIDGERLADDAFEALPGRFILHTPPSGAFDLTLVTEINPEANSQLMGLYRSNGTYCTQCEAEGFRRITYFYDRPDVLALYNVRIEARKQSNPHLLANGNLVEQGDMEAPEGRPRDEAWHYAIWHDPFPKPSYLFAMVAGDLAKISDQFTTASGRAVDLHIYVEHGKEDRVAYAMDALKRSMRWDEEMFGLEYDLDIFQIVAVSDFNMGAMENKGLNIFNDKYVLAKPETATDTDYALIEAVIAHEYFHNWTGNRITCRDWFQLCLKEGLTVYRDQEFSSDMRSRPVKRISDVRNLKARQFPEDGGPLAHPVRPESYSEINNFYTATVYEKGAELCRMIETIIGKAGFRSGMDLYFTRHDGEAATIEDFLTAFEDATGTDLGQFYLWYHQAGTPEIVASYSYAQRRKELTLSIEQACPPTPGQPTKKVMHIPLRFGLVAKDGSKATFTQLRDDRTGEIVAKGGAIDVLHITERQQRYVFEGVEVPALPSLLRGFSAPVYLRTNLTLEDQLVLMRHDDDSFNRWQAAQFIYMDHLRQTSRQLRDEPGTATNLPDGLVETLRGILLNETLEPAFRAKILALPGEDDIAREMGRNVDPDAIHEARKMMKSQLATALAEDLRRQYLSLRNPEKAYSPDATSAGQRALTATVLDLLQALDSPEAHALAIDQYRSASNMTDRFAALASLAHGTSEKAAELLQDFHDRFDGDALVIDKWLSLQATSPQPQALDQVKALMQHPSFAMSNPNRVRALIGSFAMSNPVQFNRRDGEGYRLVADVILELDKTNPQTAARLLNNFRSWRVLEPVRQGLARGQLNRISDTKPLSKDVADIASRCLQ